MVFSNTVATVRGSSFGQRVDDTTGRLARGRFYSGQLGAAYPWTDRVIGLF